MVHINTFIMLQIKFFKNKEEEIKAKIWKILDEFNSFEFEIAIDPRLG